jgi:cytochrome c oxidase subunit 2
LASGETVTADDAYLTNSIVDPASQIVAGFENVMPPDYGEKLTADEVADIVAYINSLG